MPYLTSRYLKYGNPADCVTDSYWWPGPFLNQTFTTDTTITIPADVSSVNYTIHGGKGGRGGPANTRVNTNGAAGAKGQKISGTLTNVAGHTLTLILGVIGGNGGGFIGGYAGYGYVFGGSGGNDFSAVESNFDAGAGGGGGGATAITIGSTLLALAGGGGGGACICFSPGPASVFNYIPSIPQGRTSSVITSTGTAKHGGFGSNSGASFNGAGGGGGGGFGTALTGGTLGGAAPASGNDSSGEGGWGGDGYYNSDFHASASTLETSDSDLSYIEISYGDANDGIRNEVTNAYMSIFGRYGEQLAVEGHVSAWVSGGPAVYVSIYNMVYQYGVSSGELAAVNASGKHTGMSTSPCPVLGCTDSNATNYDPNATDDDGSCYYAGCTNQNAINYDPNATVDDGSCTFNPPTVSLSASLSSIASGDCTTLTYSSSSPGTSPFDASLTGFSNPGFSGSVEVCPTSTTTYTYQVCNSGGCTSKSVTITVIPLPSITLSATLNSIVAGNCTTISWSTSGTVDSISWNAGSGITNGNLSSSEVVCPTDTTTYTVTATATILGTVYTSVATVTVIVYQVPSITLSATLNSIAAGDCTSLQWSTSGTVDSISWNSGSGITNGNFNSSEVVCPTDTTTYTVTATATILGTVYTSVATVTITVIPLPSITLSATLNTIVAGDCTSLQWSTSGTVDSISWNSGSGITNGNFSNSEVKSEVVCPTDTTTYTVTATATILGTVYTSVATVTITVIPLPSITLSSTLNSIVAGNCTTISWSTSGTVDSVSWNAESGITNGNFNSSEVVCPTDTTTYTVTATATILGTVYTSVATVTVIVYQVPSINYFSAPESVLYNENPVVVEYGFSYANISAELAVSLLYQGSPTYELDTTYFITPISGGALISSPNITRSGILDTYIPYNLLGPNKIQYILTVNGSGGTTTKTLITDVIVDRTPDNITIPETDEKIKEEEPVYSPDIAPNDVIISQLMGVNGIDVPVEIKSNYPIKVIVNQSNVLENVREL